MPIEIKMPKLSQTTDDVRLIRWLIKEGDTLRKGDILCEVENDKTIMELESFSSGTVLHLYHKPDSLIPAGTVIALLETEYTESVRAVVDSNDDIESSSYRDLDSGCKSTSVNRIEPLPPGVRATRLMQNIASKRGIDLSQVHGTGPRGQITKMDLEEFLSSGAKPEQTSEATIEVAKEAVTHSGSAAAAVVEFSPHQLAVGRNLQISKTQVPHYYIKATLYCENLLTWREIHHRTDGVKVSLNALLIHATARALKRHSRLNAWFREGQLHISSEINIGLAVSAGEELYAPVVRNAGSMTAQEIGEKLRCLVDKVKNGKLDAEEERGGTFTISNLGMYPVDEFTAIINPPQVAILAFGRIQKKLTVDEAGSMRLRSTCTVTGSFDHRAVNGVQGAIFLEELKMIIEEEL